jgi:hypothetical protein
MKKYTRSDKILVVDDEKYFETKKLLSIEQCNCFFKNKSMDSLVYFFNHNENPGPANRCLVKALFDKNVLLAQIEENIQIARPFKERRKYDANGESR